jgi:hypothetical protein
MSAEGRRCVRCRAGLAPDQQFCLECGAAQSSAADPHWRRPLIAAALTLVLSALALVVGYVRMRDDADQTAASRPAAQAVKQAGASASAGASGTAKPARSAHLAARSTP